MGMVRFNLDGVSAFKELSQNGDGRHYCVNCAGEAARHHTVIPFLESQLQAALSDFGKEMAAMLTCDQCGQAVAAYYPENFWGQEKKNPILDRNTLIFKKF
ncbi:MAG: hypothetical protein JRI36_07045 [Deltaproteobacteria bacterium]|nr:hypothetical protein [Deltaproteobacteria bacterium]